MTPDEKQNLLYFYQEYAKAVRQLSAAFGNLLEVWNICDNLENEYNVSDSIDFMFESYPFSKSFDDVRLDVLDFKDEVQEWADNLDEQTFDGQ